MTSCSTRSVHYQSASRNLLYTFLFGKSSVIVPSMVASNMAQMHVSIPEDLEKKLAESLKANQPEIVDQTIGRIFDYIATLNYDYMVYMVLHLCIILRNAFHEISENRLAAVSMDISHVINRIVEGESLGEVRQLVLDTVRQFREKLAHPEEYRNEVLIEAIKDVIQANYTNLNLGLQEIADIMKMSPSYIGKLFRRSRGLSVAEYINEVRLRIAVEYLEQGTYTINEIIDQVGFGNRGNFYKVFKKKYGTTPREYRIKKSLSE